MLSMAKKLDDWERTLDNNKLALIAYAVKKEKDDVVDKEIDKRMHAINQSLATSIAAAIFDLQDLSVKEVEEIIFKGNEYMKDSQKFLERWGDDWIMKVNEIKPKIEREAIKLLEGEKSQAEAVKNLKEKFKDMPTKDLVNIYKETKEEWMKPKVPLADKKATLNKPKLEDGKSSNVIAPKMEIKSVNKLIEQQKHNFEVVEKKIVLKGKYGTYKKDNSGVLAGEIKFTNLEEIKAYKNKELEEFKRQIDEFNNHVEEIEAAFSWISNYESGLV